MPDAPDRVTAQTAFLACGEAALTVWEEEAARVGSPLSRADLAACWQEARPHTALALAVALKESVLGRDAVRPGNALGLMAYDGSRFLAFASWADGFREWRKRVTDATYKGGVYPTGLSLEGFVATYCGGPACWQTGGRTCANGETWDGATGGSIGLYLTQTVDRINDYLRRTAAPATPGGGAAVANPFPKPPIYDLAVDFDRYGLTKAQADKIRANCFPGRQGYSPLAFVFHIMEGTTAGSLQWWATGPGVQASSTWMASRDGSLLRVVDPASAPWTNGDVNRPSQRGQALISRIGGANPNLVSETVEVEGYTGQALTTPQLQAVCWLAADRMAVRDWTETNLYRHSDFNSVTRANCPGPYVDSVLAALRAGGQAQPRFPGLPPGISDADVLAWFPEASPSGPVTKLWLDRCLATGRWPQRVKVDTATPGSPGPWSRRFLFSDGLVIYADQTGRVWQQEGATT